MYGAERPSCRWEKRDTCVGVCVFERETSTVAMCIAVGKVSFDDCPLFTWSLGWIVLSPSVPPWISMARFAITLSRRKSKGSSTDRHKVPHEKRKQCISRRHAGPRLHSCSSAFQSLFARCGEESCRQDVHRSPWDPSWGNE